ncbi:MAG: hypothetical protein LBF38_10555 [Deltaproteobacteria bacterium]|nr:hypothetical protein [Deltaproteobacteria bacterium]
MPSGALKTRYKGPYPPKGKTHDYQFTVEALNADKVVIAIGAAKRSFMGK